MLPLAFVFHCVVMIRMRLYDLGLLRSVRLPAKVISVGNLTTGGTGKTPLVEKLCHIIKEEGYRVGVLSRGWKRQDRGVSVVSDGNKILKIPEEAGDEPYLLAKNLPGIPVIIGKNRAQAGQLAVQKYGCEILILDDGFQHFRVRRDFDFVIVDATNPWGNGRLIPAGPLRESVSGLGRASAVCLTRVDQTIRWKEKKEAIETYSKAPVFTSRHRPVGWVSLDRSTTIPLETLKKQRVLAFAGIGHPNAFERTLHMIDVKIVDFIRYRDHFWYSEQDLTRIRQTARAMGVKAVVTTEKDAARLSKHRDMETPFYYLKIELEFDCEISEIKNVLTPTVLYKR